MGIKIKLMRDDEPHYFYRSAVPAVDNDSGHLVSDKNQLWIRRSIQQLQAELRRQEAEELFRKYSK